MIAASILFAALVCGQNQPMEPEEITVHRVAGPVVQFPVKIPLDKPDVVGVQVWSSDDRGRTWRLASEIGPAGKMFEFRADKPGEYWFAAQLQFKTGVLPPTEPELKLQQRVFIETGAEPGNSLRPAKPATTAEELTDELNRIELDLIRNELKRLAESKSYTRETEELIDRLHQRLRQTRERLRTDKEPPRPGLPVIPVVPESFFMPPPRNR